MKEGSGLGLRTFLLIFCAEDWKGRVILVLLSLVSINNLVQ